MAFVRSSSLKPAASAIQAAAATPAGELVTAALVLAAGQIVLTGALSGMHAHGMMLALLAFGLSAGVAAGAVARGYPHPRLGLCNAVTLIRLALATALLAPLAAGHVPSWPAFALAAFALALDGIDGWLARRYGHTSEFGAWFDMEVDSVLALVLAASAASVSGLGVIALALGLPRYVFAAAYWCVPWMRRPLPERYSRKVVCVVQMTALIALQLPVLPNGAGVGLAIVAALALFWSFAVDLIWLWRRRG